LKLPEGIQGKFPLSSFRNKALAEFIWRNGRHTVEFGMTQSMSHRYPSKHRKVEVLTANYPVSVNRAKKESVSGLAAARFYRF
jgi:DNA adenine methylase